MTRQMLSALAVLLITGCASCQTRPVVTVIGVGGSGGMGGANVAGSRSPGTPCEQAESTLVRLGCPQAVTPSRTRFSTACEAARADGRDWHPDCIAKVASCNDVDAAYRGCK